MAKRKVVAKQALSPPSAENYRHVEATSPLRPDVGTQSQFKKKKPPATYRYDSSLSPALDWDGQNAAREQGEALLAEIRRRLEEISRGSTQTEADQQGGEGIGRGSTRKGADSAEVVGEDKQNQSPASIRVSPRSSAAKPLSPPSSAAKKSGRRLFRG